MDKVNSMVPSERVERAILLFVSSLAVEISEPGKSSVSPVGESPSDLRNVSDASSRTANQVIENPIGITSRQDI